MPTKLRRSLFIGLGGTGMNTLLNTKKMLYDTYGEIPPMIGFLGIDTDGGVYNKSLTAKDGTVITLTQSEQSPITVGSPSAIYRNSPSKFAWLPPCNAGSLTSLSIGAGAIRSNGRFALTINRQNILNALSQKFAQIRNAVIIDNPRYELLATDTDIHLVFSLSGGTGCGTFINMAYLLNELLPECKLSGYAVMADVFRAMNHGPAMARVRANALGAIKDLDYLMHLDVTKDPVEISYLQATSVAAERPFDAIYLIDNKNANGDTFLHVDRLSEMISLSLVTSIGELSNATASVSDNVTKLINDGVMDIRDKRAWASGFGVSEITFESNRLADIYARKAAIRLIEMMLNSGPADPALIANNWIDENAIRENLGKDDVTEYFMPAMPETPFIEPADEESPLPGCRTYLGSVAIPPAEILDEKAEKLRARVLSSLDHLVREQLNAENGVHNVGEILAALTAQITECDNEMKEEMSQLRAEMPGLDSNLETACAELEKCMSTWLKLHKKEYLEDVATATNILATKTREMRRRELARNFYRTLLNRIQEKAARLNIIRENLEAVRRKCTSDNENALRQIGSGSFFQFDLAAARARSITCMPGDIVFNNFAKAMQPRGGVASFADMNSDSTAQAIMEFVSELPTCRSIAAMTVDDALESLSTDELTDVCRRALNKALPLFNYDYRGYDADVKGAPSDMFYIGVPDKNNSRLVRDGFLRSLAGKCDSMEFPSTGITDRVIIYRQVGVVPAFTISSIENYQNEYDNFERDKRNTSHWDNDLCARVAAEHFTITPHSEVSEHEAIELWVMSLLYGMLKVGPDGVYRIKSKALGGRPLQGFMVDLAGARDEAFAIFTEKLPLIKDELLANIQALDVPGPDNLLRRRNKEARESIENQTYIDAISQVGITQHDLQYYPAISDLLDREATYILENL